MKFTKVRSVSLWAVALKCQFAYAMGWENAAETFWLLSVMMGFCLRRIAKVGGFMLAVRFRIPLGVCGLICALSCWGANFGTVVPINGTVSDIALDERRNVVWAANFSAYRVEQVYIPSQSLLAPLTVPMPPSAVAISPDDRFLVVGEYQKPDPLELSTNPFAPEADRKHTCKTGGHPSGPGSLALVCTAAGSKCCIGL